MQTLQSFEHLLRYIMAISKSMVTVNIKWRVYQTRDRFLGSSGDYNTNTAY